MWRVRCGLWLFCNAETLVLEQVLITQITRVRRVICTCCLEKLLSRDIKYCPFPLMQNKDMGSWWDLYTCSKRPCFPNWLCLLSVDFSVLLLAIKLRGKQLTIRWAIGREQSLWWWWQRKFWHSSPDWRRDLWEMKLEEYSLFLQHTCMSGEHGWSSNSQTSRLLKGEQSHHNTERDQPQGRLSLSATSSNERVLKRTVVKRTRFPPHHTWRADTVMTHCKLFTLYEVLMGK